MMARVLIAIGIVISVANGADAQSAPYPLGPLFEGELTDCLSVEPPGFQLSREFCRFADDTGAHDLPPFAVISGGDPCHCTRSITTEERCVGCTRETTDAELRCIFRGPAKITFGVSGKERTLFVSQQEIGMWRVNRHGEMACRAGRLHDVAKIDVDKIELGKIDEFLKPLVTFPPK